MKRICPMCQTAMKDNCYVKDTGISTLSYLQLFIKKENYKKEQHEINASYCPKCGHIELHMNLHPKEEPKKDYDDQSLLFETVKKYANEHRQRIEEERLKKEKEAKNKKKIRQYSTRKKRIQQNRKTRKSLFKNNISF